MNVQAAEPTCPQTSVGPSAGLRRLVLAGFMGAGKTTVGRILAARLGWEFLDLDTYIEQRTGMTVAAIFAEQGEAYFRRVESTALVSALGKDKVVLALGGGTPELLTNRLLLEQTPGTRTVFLDAPFSALFDRCMLQAMGVAPAAAPDQPLRPLLADPAAAESRFLARQPIYRRLAQITISTSDLSPERAVDELLNQLRTLT